MKPVEAPIMRTRYDARGAASARIIATEKRMTEF